MIYKVIGLSGKAQAGKTTTAETIRDIIKEIHPDAKVAIRPFAFALKEIALKYFEWKGDKGIEKDGRGKVKEDKGRQLLINIGKKFRDIRPTIWADIVVNGIKREIKDGQANNKIYIIDDMRFRNELKALSEFAPDFVSMRISRPEELDIDDISETDLDAVTSWDARVQNDGTKEELKEQLENLLEQKGWFE